MAGAVYPVASFKLEEVTNVTPLDQLLFVRLSNFRQLGTENIHKEITVDGRNWDLRAVRGGRYHNYQLSLTLLPATETRHFGLKTDMAVISSAGNLVNLRNPKRCWENWKGPRAIQPFHFALSRQKATIADDNLKLCIWISRLPNDQFNEETFEQQFSVSKQHFMRMQSVAKADLFVFDREFRRYTSRHYLNARTFESFFDYNWLPTFFNYGDLVVQQTAVPSIHMFTVTIHNFNEWNISGSTFRQNFKVADVHEWLLTVKPDVNNDHHQIVFRPTTAYNSVVQVYITLGFDDFDFEFDQASIVLPGGMATFNVGTFVCDRLKVNNQFRFAGVIKIRDPIVLISSEGTSVELLLGKLTRSRVILEIMNDNRDLHEHDRIEIRVPFETATLVDLYRFAVFGTPTAILLRPNPTAVIQRHTPMGEKIFAAADFLHLDDLKNQIELAMGYEPALPESHIRLTRDYPYSVNLLPMAE